MPYYRIFIYSYSHASVSTGIDQIDLKKKEYVSYGVKNQQSTLYNQFWADRFNAKVETCLELIWRVEC